MVDSKRACAMLLVMVCLLAVLPMSASANSPGVSPWYEIKLSNLPEGTVWVDMLVKLPETDEKYVSLVEKNLPKGLPEDSQIITFAEEDYRSYTLHYKDALSVTKVGISSRVKFFTTGASRENENTVRFDHADEIFRRGKIRLAMVDRNGGILKVSPPLSLGQDRFLFVPTGGFSYDAATDEFTVSGYVSGIAWVAYLLMAAAGMILTCFIEKQTAALFGLKGKYGKQIVRINMVSQVLMHMGYALLYGLVFWEYPSATVLLEVGVYTGEYLVYCHKMKEIPWKKRLSYVVSANTASLVLGLLLFRFLLY